MAVALPATSREIHLADLPGGLPGPEHFRITRKPVPLPGPGQVVVRNRYFLVFPGLRTLIGGQAVGVPLPRIHVGDALFGPAVGEVVAAAPGGPLRPGTSSRTCSGGASTRWWRRPTALHWAMYCPTLWPTFRPDRPPTEH